MLNLEYYSGKDLYSDGDIEDELLAVFKEGRDVNKVIACDNRWPVLYHLSPERLNLLRWYPFRSDQSLLEIGAGCGALTGLFCRKLRSVTAVDLSKRRSEANKERNKHHTNLEIIVGNFDDIVFNETFDYITLIGVLEYTRSFSAAEDPYALLFDKINSLLKPDGTVIIAIENKFGLKYWAGAKDDHTSELFDAMQGYRKNRNYKSIETFGLDELRNLLTRNKLKTITMYYPYPDYKMPEVIFSDDMLPNPYTYFPPSPHYDKKGYKLFNESAVLHHIIKNGQFPFFANSFLCLARR